MEKYLETVLNQCLDILESDSGSILLLDNCGQEIIVRVARGKNKDSILGTKVKFGEGISGLVAAEKKPLLVEDARKDSKVKERCRTGNYKTHSFLSVPIIYNGKLLGVLNVTEKNNSTPFTIKELSFVSAIAGCAGQVVDRIIYTEHLERQLECFKNSTAVTRFTSSVAHELNNPLDGILRYVYLCSQQVKECTPVSEYLVEIKLGLDRMSEIIKSMLSFSFAGDRKFNPINRQEVELNKVIEQTLSFYRNQAQWRKIKVEARLGKDIPKIIDNGLGQLFDNFVKNAFEAMNEGGKLTVNSYRENGTVCVDFMDTGIGINADLKDKIFEPFFSTKPSGKGLGLAIAKEIIGCYKGEIKLENLSKGTKFTLKIPLGGKR